MARRRTKKDKIIAGLRRQVVSKQSTSQDKQPENTVVYLRRQKKVNRQPLQTASETSLYSYDPAFLRKDLAKTVLLSIVSFGVIFVLYYVLR